MVSFLNLGRCIGEGGGGVGEVGRGLVGGVWLGCISFVLVLRFRFDFKDYLWFLFVVLGKFCFIFGFWEVILFFR